MNLYLQKVREWHELFQVSCPTKPDLSAETCALRCRLLIEEKDELMQAISDDSRVEQLDAMCDLQYVLSGAILQLGLTEIYGLGNTDRMLETGPVLVSQKLAIAGLVALMSIKIKYLSTLCAGGNVNSVAGCLRDIQFTLDKLIVSLGFREVFEDAFMEVHRNNFQKLWDNEEMNNAPGGYVFYGSGYGLWIGKDAGGKVKKPPSHPKVDLSRFVK